MFNELIQAEIIHEQGRRLRSEAKYERLHHKHLHLLELLRKLFHRH